MSGFADRLTRCPRPFQPERGADAADAVPGLAPPLAGLVAGAAGASPYLADLVRGEAGWLAGALAGQPEAALDGALDAVRGLADADLAEGLRAAKRRVALLVALADLGGVWDLDEVTGALTRLADLAADRAFRAAVDAEIARGRLPGDTGDCAGLVVFAMGKMGAFELNYSSDIDLIVLFDEARHDPGAVPEARAALVRATRRATAILSDPKGGYVFRTDLRLRPDAAVTPVCLSMEAAERYYESLGRTWERAAWIKARPCAGDLAAGAAFQDRLAPFVWRRHLDFWAIRDAQDMRVRIRAHKELGGALTLAGHDVKLGKGGIREIEFYTQTRQVILGGRDLELRPRGTVAALRALHARGWAEPAETLIADYRAHREVEHRLQMVADRQTHALPRDAAGFARLAAMMDRDEQALRAELRARFERVAAITEEFFAPGAAPAAPEIGEAAAQVVARWPSYPALRSARAVEIFERVKPQILSRLTRAAQPEEALAHIDAFLAGLPAGVQVFSLFEANPQLIDLIVDIAATSPALAQYLSRHALVLDAVIGGSFFADWPGAAGLAADLAALLARQDDYEARLLAARAWRNEWHFRVGVHHLRGLIDGAEAGVQYADLADAVLAALWDPVVAEFAAKHGPPPGRGAAVLAMGSLGARTMTATSDLDLIVIYDAAGVEGSDGRRPLAARSYYARLTQALVTALSANLGPGKLYDVDMRLRPSGRQGPVATALTGFRSYQSEEAWTWEHLALTRARAGAGTAELGDEIEAFRRALLERERDPRAVLADVAGMRARLAEAKPGQGIWDAKLGPGRLQDVALLAQAGALLAGSPARDVTRQLADGAGALGLTDAEHAALDKAHALCWRVQAAQRLMTGDGFDADAVGAGGRAFLLREAAAPDMAALEAAIGAVTARAEAAIGRILEVR